MPHILIVEDDLTFSTMLRTWLGKKGFQVTTASSVARAIALLKEADADGAAVDLILSDLRLPDHDGLFLLAWQRKVNPAVPFIIMTHYAEVQNAVEAMKAGATDYVAKPVQPDVLLSKIHDALQTKPAVTPTPDKSAPKPAADNSADPAASLEYLEGTSEAARRLYQYVALVAPTPMSVLIQGASGTGKEYVARRIHQQSKRASGPFVAIDCGALTKELAASELFGHVKGAFTGAVSDKTGAFVSASGGTLFLDEVGNLGYDVQVQLLRAVQERRVRPVGATQEQTVDIRLVCATNENLSEAVARGTFREDLFHRINEFTLFMPQLRERGTDLLLFADLFLRQANRELERNLLGFDARAAELLTGYEWPGNLRELKNVVKRATLLATGDRISRDELAAAMNAPAVSSPLPLHDRATERDRIVAALKSTGGNKSKAAVLLGIDRKTLYNKLKALDIEE
ncbi:MAG: sigma-54 dependent transcriptional regulator [Bacteroidales bacterium]|nr:sigma-54 dependent transcriptional regulator [Bacteroidales bacterium]